MSPLGKYSCSWTQNNRPLEYINSSTLEASFTVHNFKINFIDV